MALNPNIRQQAQEEISRVLGKNMAAHSKVSLSLPYTKVMITSLGEDHCYNVPAERIALMTDIS